jgi:hypothetical protein
MPDTLSAPKRSCQLLPQKPTGRLARSGYRAARHPCCWESITAQAFNHWSTVPATWPGASKGTHDLQSYSHTNTKAQASVLLQPGRCTGPTGGAMCLQPCGTTTKPKQCFLCRQTAGPTRNLAGATQHPLHNPLYRTRPVLLHSSYFVHWKPCSSTVC